MALRWKRALNKVKMGKKVEKVVKEKTITPVEEEGPRNPEDYVCTGNLEQDFTELCNRMEILEYPLVIPRHTAVSLNGLLDEMQSLSASDKSTPSSAAGTKEHISVFRPTVQVEMDNDDTKLVKAIYIRAWVIDERYIFILQRCLPALTALQTVSLWNVGLTKDTFIALVAIFRQCANLRSVVLDGNPIDQQPYHLLMSEDSTIQNLTLRNNQIDDSGAKLIGEALSTTKKCNRTLASLNLNFNHITDVGICSIADGLRLNRSLLWLSAAYNQISDIGAKKLAEVLIPFALTHEEIVERRLLQLNSQEQQRMITVPRRPDSKSDRSSQLGSTTTLDKSDKSQRSTKGASKKKDKRDTTIPEKPVAAASQISPKRDDIRMLKRGSITKMEFSKIKGKVTKRNISADQELPGAHRPLLEAADHRDGQVYLAGNTCLLSLNLSHNRITEMGLKALLEALKVQVSSNKPTTDGRTTSGLLRLLVAKNEFPPMCDSYTSLQELILARDPITKHRIICSPMPSHSGSQ